MSKLKNKLCNCVEILENNEYCVILKVKPDKKTELIALGYFDLQDNMYRLTKGNKHICTVFRNDNTSYSWEWGEGGHTIVSDELSKKGKLIEECITEDFDIYIGNDLQKIQDTLYIKYLNDSKNVSHTIKYLYFKNENNICVHKDDVYYRNFNTIESANNHFKNLGYELGKIHKSKSLYTGCFIDEFSISRSLEKDDLEL